MDPSATKEQLSQSFALAKYVQGLKRTRDPDQDDDTEDVDDILEGGMPAPGSGVPLAGSTKLKKKPKPKTVAALSSADHESADLLYEMQFKPPHGLSVFDRDTATCNACGQEGHGYRRCPTLRLPDGGFRPFCTYCYSIGHICGSREQPECPILMKSECPGCGKGGHTFDWCPHNTCRKCSRKGHISRNCRHQQNGTY